VSNAQPETFDPKAFLRHDDVLASSLVGPPQVTLYHESLVSQPNVREWLPGYWQSRCCVESCLIDEADFEKCSEAPIQNFNGLADAFKVDCYDPPSKYVPGEEAELFCGEAGVLAVEPVYFDQFWDGLGGKCLLEPSQRLTLYLELERRPVADTAIAEWVDPYDGRVVITRRDVGHRRDERRVTICLDRLRDYLAARGRL